jgi:hypothetical protein
MLVKLPKVHSTSIWYVEDVNQSIIALKSARKQIGRTTNIDVRKFKQPGRKP